MKIAMFMLFFVCNMFTVLIMRFAYESNYRYNNGMLIGVHIPGDHVNDDDVTRLMTHFKKSMKYFQNINAVLSIAICFLNFVNIIIFVIMYTIWILVFVCGIMYIQLSAHRKMYLIKVQNGWFVESQKQKVFGLVFHIYMNRRQNQAYSLNSDINNIVNLTMKKYIASAMLVMSLLNFVAWITFVLMCIIQDTVGDLSFWMYIILQLLSGCTLTVILILARNRKNEMLKADTQPVFVDDDDYWKTGFYYNPNDPHLFVPDRLCSTNYSLNYARTGAKIFTGTIAAFTLGLIIWTTIVLIPYIHVTIDIRTTDSTVNVSSCGYTSLININDIIEITLMDSLPDDHFYKYNGGATDSYLVGKFKGNTYGKCYLYIFNDVSPVLMIKTADQTVFLNSKKDGEIVNLYNAIKKE